MGARVYEHQDFEQAIELLANSAIDIEPYISSVSQLADIKQAFYDMSHKPQGLKALVACQPELNQAV